MVKYLYSILLVGLLLAFFILGSTLAIEDPDEPVERVIRYKLEAKNKTSESVEHAIIKVFAPVESIGRQQTIDVQSDREFKVESDEYGNQLLIFDVSNVAPYSNLYINITARVQFRKNNKNPPLNLMVDRFLEEEKYVEKNNLKISMLASTLIKKADNASPIEVAKETHDWITKNMTYTGYQKRDLGAGYAIRHLKGDCTEYMYLNTAIMRAQGVANIPVAGFYLADSVGLLNINSYHNWNYFWDGQNWLISDSQGDVFNRYHNKYVVFRILAKDEIQTLSNSHRFSVSDKRLSVKII